MSKNEQRIADLISRFQDKFDRRKYAIQALIKIGPPAVDAVIQVLTDSNVYAKAASAIVLGGIKDTRALDALLNALEDERQRVRHAVADALAEIGDAKAIPMLQEKMKEEETWQTHPSLVALKRLGAFPKPQSPSNVATPQFTFVPVDAYKSTQDARTAPLLQTSVALTTSTINNNIVEEYADKSWIPHIHMSGFVINPAISAALAREGYNGYQIDDDPIEDDSWNSKQKEVRNKALIANLISGTQYSRLCAADDLYNLASVGTIKPLCRLLNDPTAEHYSRVLWLVQCIVVTEASALLEVPNVMLQTVTNNWTLVSQDVYNEYKNWTAPVPSTKSRSQEARQKAQQQNRNKPTPDLKNSAPSVAPPKKTPARSGYAIPTPPPLPAPKVFALDMDSVRQKIAETAQVQELLQAQFVEDEGTPAVVAVMDAPADMGAEATETNPFKSLDTPHFAFLNMLMRKPLWKRQDVEAVAKPLGLMTSGALERLNEMALEMGEDNIFEGDDPIEVNIELIRELLL